ncbi:MAG: photosystem I reaction center protein subunit XI [Synechococcales cyanobacterium RM1_1_8]|nr:photosystem I reaction center protein subunit XI [Synechococcales cyanobacterium RM1_1_8]
MSSNAITPYQGDPFVGHLSTPVSDSALVRSYLSKLPINRKGLGATMRGIEIGMAHGYFLYGPFAELGPLRNSDISDLAGLASAIGLVIIAASGMRLYGNTAYDLGEKPHEQLKTKQGWADLSKGFVVGGAGGALFAYLVTLGGGFLG